MAKHPGNAPGLYPKNVAFVTSKNQYDWLVKMAFMMDVDISDMIRYCIDQAMNVNSDYNIHNYMWGDL